MTSFASMTFLDTETLGLDEAAPIWEFAAVRRHPAVGGRIVEHFTIQHEPGDWLDSLPKFFRDDYEKRYDEATALPADVAARRIQRITANATIVGAVPSFDTVRLTRLLQAHGLVSAWNYHLVDIENVAVGYIAGAAPSVFGDRRRALVSPPYSSDELSAVVGVNPKDFPRHTAMGDVEWCMAQWDRMIPGVSAAE